MIYYTVNWLKCFLITFVCIIFGFMSCNDNNEPIEIEKETIIAQLDGFRFLAKNNPKSLISDIECTIIGDSIIECLIPHIVENKILIPSFEIIDGDLSINGTQIVSDETILDCTTPLNIEITGVNYKSTYELRVKAFTGLPIVYIDTENQTPITSKDEYVKGTIRIVEDLYTRGAGEIFESTMKIKGRGNSTWGLPKKPYKIKFDEKTSLLGEPADKEWVLLANYSDKTLLRNETSFDMSRMSNLDYTNRTHFVDVILNSVYNGTYQLAEQLKISKNRVNVGDDGYLLEIDAKAAADDITFKVGHIGQPINIKDPEVEVDSEAYNYVVNYLQITDEILFSENFADKNNGYAKYIDTESFVDWYLINEIAKNNDAIFWTSCYMNLARGSKLKMGPIWDFDIAFGNIDYTNSNSPEGFYVMYATWFVRLFQDPAFVSKVKERFAYFYENREIIYAKINTNAEYLKYAIVENNNKWGTLYTYTWPNNMIWGSYENEVQSMKIWLERRFEWLHNEFSQM